MECLTNIKIQEYVEGSLNSVESAMVRDHIIVCEKCGMAHREYEKLERFLLQPVESVPPAIIERNVLKALFPKLPTYSSIITLVAASFTLLVTWIYIYFDFAHNSIIQALKLTTNNTSAWVGAIIRFISTVFSSVYVAFKAINRLLNILFGVNLGVEIIGLTIISFCLLVFYSIFRTAYRKLKS